MESWRLPETTLVDLEEFIELVAQTTMNSTLRQDELEIQVKARLEQAVLEGAITLGGRSIQVDEVEPSQWRAWIRMVARSRAANGLRGPRGAEAEDVQELEVFLAAPSSSTDAAERIWAREVHRRLLDVVERRLAPGSVEREVVLRWVDSVRYGGPSLSRIARDVAGKSRSWGCALVNRVVAEVLDTLEPRAM